MAIDTIARGLAAALVGPDGKIDSAKMPVMGAVPEGTNFYPVGQLNNPSLVAGKTAEEILLMMLYGIVSPTLTEPSLSIMLNEDSLPLIIGRQTALKGTLTFDRGKIDPAFGTSGYRAGTPISYSVGDTVTESSGALYDFEILLIPTSTSINLEYGVTYQEGEQPLNSIGEKMSAPFPAGSITSAIDLKATYMMYDAQHFPLDFTWFKDEDGQGYLSTFASEGNGIQQSFAISKAYTVIGVKGFDTITQQWSWLGGQTAAVSLTHFDTTIINGDSLGEENDYILYTHNQPASGERELRIYVI